MKITARLAMLCLAALSFAGQAHNVTMPEDIKDMSLKKVADNVYVVHGIHAMPDKDNKGFISNSGLVVSDEGVVIIDTGGSLQIGDGPVTTWQRPTGSQVSCVHACPSSQTSGTPASQVPAPSHVSSPLQTSPSGHGVPAVASEV